MNSLFQAPLSCFARYRVTWIELVGVNSNEWKMQRWDLHVGGPDWGGGTG